MVHIAPSEAWQPWNSRKDGRRTWTASESWRQPKDHLRLTRTIHGDDGIFTYIYRKNQPSAGKYTMDGLYGPSKRVNQQDDSIWCGCVKIMSIHICRYI